MRLNLPSRPKATGPTAASFISAERKLSAEHDRQGTKPGGLRYLSSNVKGDCDALLRSGVSRCGLDCRRPRIWRHRRGFSFYCPGSVLHFPGVVRRLARHALYAQSIARGNKV
ncbi:hypothetical protein RHECNPAF_2330027 [Rhizobium etli CNPAF512]|nr:hypothetical protein RHECNPAF_2330027 [Rhizobium etli CNPAF512]